MQKPSKIGRPTKYKPEYASQGYDLCLLGYTDKELAEFFEVNEDTIHEWKKKHSEFSEKVRGGKDLADSKVAAALFKRAVGFTYDEVTFEKIELGKMVMPAIEEDDEMKKEVYKKKDSNKNGCS